MSNSDIYTPKQTKYGDWAVMHKGEIVIMYAEKPECDEYCRRCNLAKETVKP